MYRIYNDDCLLGLAREPAESIDVIVTSPPYNLGIQYDGCNDRGPREAWLDWLTEWARAVHRVLAPDGSLFLNLGGKPTDPYGPYEAVLRLREVFELQNTIHWVKSMSYYLEQGAAVEGHVKTLNSERFLNDAHEFVFHWTKTGWVGLDKRAPGVGVEYADKSNLKRGTRGKHGDRRCAGNIWHLAYDTINSREKDRGDHPATFPMSLVERCYRLHGLDRIRRAADPFLGTGTSGEVALRLGLDFLGWELSPRYFGFAAERLARVHAECHPERVAA